MTDLARILDSLGDSSRFATSGRLPAVLPGLEVDGIGSVGFPLSPADAKRLIKEAQQAPYGRGKETIVDTNVRRVWQIDPIHFALKNSDWNGQIESIVDLVRRDFGIGQKISADLYKLLIYEKGSFFALHRDTEKNANMFATLVVCLPSPHEGGSLLVHHDGQSETIDLGGKVAEFQTQYAAFYADCQHEVTPVTSGYRICLVYNLSLTGKRQPSAPQNQAAVEKARHEIENLFENSSARMEKIAVPLRHQYTEANIDPRQLKGQDRVRFEVLRRAAELLGYRCYLALLTHWQSGEADYDTFYPYPYRGRRSRRREYEEEEGGNRSDVQIGEVYDEELSLEHWLNSDGEKQPFGKIHFAEAEVLGFDKRLEWSCRQEVHEATGNEGVTVERWYHQAAVVIWPPDRFFSILAKEGPTAAVPALEQLMAATVTLDESPFLRNFAGQIIDKWQTDWRSRYERVSLATRMLILLEQISDADLAVRFVRDVLPANFNGSEGKSLARLCRRIGWDVLGPHLLDFLIRQNRDHHTITLGHIVSVCVPLCCDPPKHSESRRQVCHSLAMELSSVVKRWKQETLVDDDEEDDDDLWIEEGSWNDPSKGQLGLVDQMMHIYASVGAVRELDRFLDEVFIDSRRYNLRRVLIPDLKSLQKWLPKVPAVLPAATRLQKHCLDQLRSATFHPVERPKDWAREANLSCDCDDCRELEEFLLNPGQQVGRFPLRKDRRQHLHDQIDRHHCDCTHQTERKGSPQTLVCIKTEESFQRKRRQYESDLKLIAELETLGNNSIPTKSKKKPE